MLLSSGSRVLDLATPKVMGILNVTPDSFSDGGLYLGCEQAVARALEMLTEGADIIDIGGESTRPGALPVALDEEINRVTETVAAIRGKTSAIISVDTSKPEVIRAAVEAGADMINDVRALQLPGALEAAAQAGVPVCLMHMQGEPDTMQLDPRYRDVVAEVFGFLRARIAACESAGISTARIIVDPGFGFGKSLQHNLELLHGLDRLAAMGLPVLVGLSRKSMISHILEGAGPPVKASMAAERLAGSVTLALYAVRNGAHIVRVHDVRQTVAALKIQQALEHESAHSGRGETA